MPVFCNFFPRPVLKGALLFALMLAHFGVSVPAAEPERELTERQIDKLVEQYISAVESRSFDLWVDLLSPRHSAAPELNEEYFLEQVGSIESLSIQNIEGYNVQLRIRHASGDRRTGTVQLDPDGRIKYTPFCFKHPLYEVVAQLELLLHDQVTILGATSTPASRAKAAYILDSMGIPMYEYNPYATSSQDRWNAASKILEWLKENGQQYDKGEPKCLLPPDDFNALIERLESAAR